MHDVVSRDILRYDDVESGHFIFSDRSYKVEVRREKNEYRLVSVARHGANVATVDLDTGKMKFRISDRVDRQIANTVLAYMGVALYVVQRVPLPDESFFNVGPFLEHRLEEGEHVVSRQVGKLIVRGNGKVCYVRSDEGAIPRYEMIHVEHTIPSVEEETVCI